MEPQETQVNNQMNPDQVLASLAFTNNLQKQQAQQEQELEVPQETQENEPVEAPETQETPQGEELELEEEETPQIDPESLKNEIKAEILEELKNEFELTLKKKE